MVDEDYYKILGVQKTASLEEIKKVYRQLAAKTHPDKPGGDTAKFQSIQKAYDVLSNPDKRAQYDAQRSGFSGNPFGGFSFGAGGNPFEEIFKFHSGNGFGHHAAQQRRNKDLRVNITISLLETLTKHSKLIEIQTSTGTETVNIDVPRGISNGDTIRYAGLGDKVFGNLSPGDLYIAFTVISPPEFIVNDQDIVHNVQVDCFSAIIGVVKKVVGIDGKEFEVKLPPGCQHGTKLRIRDQGLYSVHNPNRGSLIINVNVVIPTITSEEILSQLAHIKDTYVDSRTKS